MKDLFQIKDPREVSRANLTKKGSAECMKGKAGDHGSHSM